jgi:hypothetical protein
VTRIAAAAGVSATALALVVPSAVAAQRDATPSFGTFSLTLPKSWQWRREPGIGDGPGGELSNWRLAGRHGFSPKASLPGGAFILRVDPLGFYGSASSPTIHQSEFMRLDDPARPRGQARATHGYCAASGRCFLITLSYGSNRMPSAVLAAVNKTLRSLRPTPAPRP